MTISLYEGNSRGFFSCYLALVNSHKILTAQGHDSSQIFLNSQSFTLYGSDPAVWFNPQVIHYDNITDTTPFAIYDTDHLPSHQDYQHFLSRFPWNSSTQNQIDDITIPNQTLGIHFRGTDHNTIGLEGPRVDFQNYYDLASQELDNFQYQAVFLASDELGAIENFYNWLRNTKSWRGAILWNDHARQPPGPHGLHWVDTNFEKAQLGTEVIIDACCLAKCQTIIGKSSNVTSFARIVNPNLTHKSFNKMPENIKTFIFNWPGQTERARETESALKKIGIRPIVINSDPDYTPYDWINLGNDAWFSQQWTLATQLFRGDVMFHIQADATYHDWERLISDAKTYFSKYNLGIYSPNLQENNWGAVPIQSWTGIHEHLHAVANPDCTCWFIHRDIIDKYKELNLDLSDNPIGWGIDCVVSGLSWSNKKLVLRDFSHTVNHAPGRGYDSDVANQQMNNMFVKLNPELNHIINLEFNDREALIGYLK